MALEEEIRALTAALNRNSDLLEGLTAKANAAKGAEPAKKAVETEKDESATAKKVEAEPAAEKKPRGRPKAEKAPSEADMVAATKKFLDVEAEDEYNARRDFVRKIVDKYGVQKMSQIAEDKRAAALESLDNYTRGEADEAGDEDDLA